MINRRSRRLSDCSAPGPLIAVRRPCSARLCLSGEGFSDMVSDAAIGSRVTSGPPPPTSVSYEADRSACGACFTLCRFG